MNIRKDHSPAEMRFHGKAAVSGLVGVHALACQAGHARRTRPTWVRTTVRRFVGGSTTVQITFRKRDVTPAEVLHVLDRVKAMVEGGRDAEVSSGGSDS